MTVTRFACSLLLLVLAACTQTGPSPSPTRSPGHVLTPSPCPPELCPYTGTYVLDRCATGDDSPCLIGCVLWVLQRSPAEVGFELYCQRGPPSYNSGYAVDALSVAGGVAVYEPQFFPDWHCRIMFEFGQGTVVATQDGTSAECGFGHAVYANGTYQRVDASPPVPGCMYWSCTPAPAP